MNRVFKKIFCILSVFVLGITSVLCGCGGCNDPTDNDKDIISDNNVSYSGEVKRTTRLIVDAGTSSYKILVSPDAGSNTLKAATELKVLLFEATGVELEIEKSDSYSENSNYFSLGDTVISKANGLQGDYEILKEQGYAIKTVGNDICIYSALDIGVLYGVYGYLEIALNYDYFYPKVYNIDKVSKLYLDDIDIVDVPDVNIRIAGSKYITQSEEALNRMRMIQHHETYAMAPEGGCWHNWYGYINPNIYGDEHPEFFNLKQNQLCYTAHGNAESYQMMIDMTADTMFECFKDNDKNEIVMAIGDHDDPCTCNECLRQKEKYGAYSSSVILFLNKVANQLEEKFKESGDSRADTFIIVFYAYFYVEDAPVSLTYNSKGEPIVSFEPEMKLSKHVSPKYAAAYWDYTESINSEINNRYRENLIKWNAIGKNVHLWGYDQYFRDGGFMFSYNTFFQYKDFYKTVKESKITWLYLEGQNGNDYATGWAGLKGYLQSKLGWYVDYDINYLVDKYFNAMYGSESAEMRSIFNEYIVLLNRQTQELNMSTMMGGRGFFTEALWPKNLIADWYDRFVAIENRLLAKGETLMAEHVRLESICPLYALIRLYSNTYTDLTVNSMKLKIKQLLNSFNITQISQEEDTVVYLNGLGV